MLVNRYRKKKNGHIIHKSFHNDKIISQKNTLKNIVNHTSKFKYSNVRIQIFEHGTRRFPRVSLDRAARRQNALYRHVARVRSNSPPARDCAVFFLRWDNDTFCIRSYDLVLISNYSPNIEVRKTMLWNNFVST